MGENFSKHFSILILNFMKKNIRRPSGILSIFFIESIITLSYVKIDYFIYDINIMYYLMWLFWIISFTIWFFSKDVLRKNKTEKLGIGFFVDSTILKGEDLEKEKFVNVLTENLKDNFTILFYEKYEYEILKKKKKNEFKQMNFLNLSFMFIVSEENGNVDKENNYKLKLIHNAICIPKDITCYINQNIYDTFAQDNYFLFNKSFIIKNSENLNDSKKAALEMKLSISYIYSSILCYSTAPEIAISKLVSTYELINSNPPKSNIVTYIKEHIDFRFIVAYQNMINCIMNEKNYFLNEENLEKILKYNDLIERIGSKKKNEGKINKQYNEYLIANYKTVKAIVLYDSNKKDEALKIIYDVDLTIGIYTTHFNKAFLLVTNKKYDKGFYLYSKICKNKRITLESSNELIKFIEDRLAITKDDNLIICRDILKYLINEDKNVINEMLEIISRNEEMKISFEKYICLNY